MKYYILENQYQTFKGIGKTISYKVVSRIEVEKTRRISVLDVTRIFEKDNTLYANVIGENYEYKLILGKIYFATDDLVELARKIVELENDRREVKCYE